MSVYGIRFVDESEKNFVSKGEVCSVNGAVMEFHAFFYLLFYLIKRYKILLEQIKRQMQRDVRIQPAKKMPSNNEQRDCGSISFMVKQDSTFQCFLSKVIFPDISPRQVKSKSTFFACDELCQIYSSYCCRITILCSLNKNIFS